MISFYNLLIKASSMALTSFFKTFISTVLALSANLRVLIDSSIKSIVGARVAMRHVLVLPPRESSSNLVNFDSLKGTCSFFLP